MSRYFVQRRIGYARGGRAPMSIVHSSDGWEPIGNAWHIPAVADHEAADTGLIGVSGDPIMRAPNPMGFVWGDRDRDGHRMAETVPGSVHDQPGPSGIAQGMPAPSTEGE